jgi:hypothetical protein
MRDPSRVRVAGPLAPFADGFRLELTRQGYAPSSASQRLQLMACLSGWMAVGGVSTGGLSAERVERFVEFRRRAGYRGPGRPLGLAVLLAYLRGLGVVAAAPEPGPVARAGGSADRSVPALSA